jgi:glycosyltransferase involved in cell wall biosynthesis
MRIALVSPLFESVPPRLYGGTERVIYALCDGLSEADIEVTLFAPGDSSVPGHLVPVVDEAFRLRKIPVTDPYAYNLKLLAMVAERAGEFDVIHNHHDYWMLPLTEMTTTPVLTTLHGRLDLPDIAAAFSSYPKAQFISISDSQRRPMPRLSWARTIHHGIDVGSFEFRRRPGNYLAFLGRIDREKRPDWAIEIAKKAGIPLKIAAKIEGAPGQQYFDARVKPHLDGRNIEYLGEISENEKSDFLGNALGLVFPIDWPEPFGLVMVESLACGTPVLARPCGAAPEILRDGITGYFNPDLNYLARRARELSSLDRRKCREWVERRFSLERMTEDYIDVYRELAQSGVARLEPRIRRAAGDRRHLLYSV